MIEKTIKFEATYLKSLEDQSEASLKSFTILWNWNFTIISIVAHDGVLDGK
jgi:hypothetical protein